MSEHGVTTEEPLRANGVIVKDNIDHQKIDEGAFRWDYMIAAILVIAIAVIVYFIIQSQQKRKKATPEEEEEADEEQGLKQPEVVE